MGSNLINAYFASKNSGLIAKRKYIDIVDGALSPSLKILGIKPSSDSLYIYTDKGIVRVSDHVRPPYKTVDSQLQNQQLLSNVVIENGKIIASAGIINGRIVTENTNRGFLQEQYLTSLIKQNDTKDSLLNPYAPIFSKARKSVEVPTNEELKDAAKKVAARIHENGYPTTGEEVRDIAHQMAYYYKDAVVEVKAFVNKQMENYDNLTFAQRLQLEQIDKSASRISDIIEEKVTPAQEVLKEKITQAGSDAYKGIFYQLEQDKGVKAANLNIDFRVIDKNFIPKLVEKPVAGKNISERLYSNREQLAEDVNNAISRAYLQGKTRNAAANDILKAMNRGIDGEMQGSYDKAMRIARTEMGRVMNAANLQSVQDARDLGVDVKREWSWADGDKGGIRESHQEADGQEEDENGQFTIDGQTTDAPCNFGDPSQDCNCNCTTLDIVDDIKPALGGWGDDAGEEYDNYDDWKASLNDDDKIDEADAEE